MNTNGQYLSLINDKFARFAEWIIDHPKKVIALCLIMLALSIYFSTSLRIDNSIEVYFEDNDPSFEYYKSFMKEYGNDEFLYIVYRARAGIFDLNTLNKTKMLVEDLQEVSFVEKVNAITNIEFIEGSENGDLNIYSLMHELPSSQVEAHQIMRKLLDKPLYVNGYISYDAQFAAILCEMKDKPENDPSYHMKIAAGLKNVLSKQDYEDFEFWPVGEPVINSEFNEILMKETTFLAILTQILILTLLVLFLRQKKGVIGPYLVVIFVLCMVLGYMGINDFPITAMFCLIPSLLMAIGVANTVHIITEYQANLKAGNDNRTSIIEAVRLLGFPCLFTSITTAIGFGALVLSPLLSIREYGWYTVFGILTIFVFTFTILLVSLSFAGKKSERYFSEWNFIKPEAKRLHILTDLMLRRIVYLNKKYYRSILTLGAIIIIIAVYGVTRLEVNTSWLEYIGDKMKVVQDYKFVDKTMGGTGSFEILLDSKKSDGVKTLQFVRILDRIQKFAGSENYLVTKTFSVVDIIKEVNRSLHNNKRSFYRLPDSDEEVSQFLLLYEISGGEELEKLVSADVAAARLTLYLKTCNSRTAERLHNELVRFIELVKPSEYTYAITGASFLGVKGVSYTTTTQIDSIILALFMISIMMIVVFRSLKVGLISMIPNVFPILVTLGFMGIAGIWLDFARTLISSIAIGLAVDDTIHFISRYRLEFNRLGNYEKALDAAMNGVGRAIAFTTIILVVGFGSSIVSNFNSNYYFGILTSMCIFIALLADYFICPALILVFKPFGKEFNLLLVEREMEEQGRSSLESSGNSYQYLIN